MQQGIPNAIFHNLIQIDLQKCETKPRPKSLIMRVKYEGDAIKPYRFAWEGQELMSAEENNLNRAKAAETQPKKARRWEEALLEFGDSRGQPNHCD